MEQSESEGTTTQITRVNAQMIFYVHIPQWVGIEIYATATHQMSQCFH